ncbi:MAG: leucine-rich repeat domain-containing protein [Clostridia bacterium]|nr:leucine-rich repeat domain-containing protein [Clostridia bacterium]
MRKSFQTCLFLCVIIILGVISACPADAASSGTVGGCQWSLDGTVLNITGSGKLSQRSENAPWGNSITEVIIGEGVTSIDGSVFSECKSLRKVTLPNSLRIIGARAFDECTALTSITIPSGVTTIDDYAFSDCSSLIDITIPKTVTYIGIEIFRHCYSLNNIFVDPANPSYTSVNGVLYSKDMSVLIRYPADKHTVTRTYTVPDSVKEIGMGAFESVWDLLDITLPDSITKIGFNAFFDSVFYYDKDNVYGGCIYVGNYLIYIKDENMTSCTVRAGTKTIADGAFVANHNLQHIILPEGLLSIGDSAFFWSTYLKSIYIPKSVTKIDRNAFCECNAMESVLYSGSSVERHKIRIEKYNTNLTRAKWQYDCCHGGGNHDFKSEVIIKNATCTEVGEARSNCVKCAFPQTRTIPALGHSYGESELIKKPTKKETGVEAAVCKNCGEVQSKVVNKKKPADNAASIGITATLIVLGGVACGYVIFKKRMGRGIGILLPTSPPVKLG